MSSFSLTLLRLKKLSIVLCNGQLRRAFFRYLIMGGVEHKVVLSRKLLTVVDVGANRGQFALAARAMTGATVISFEPLPEIAAIYREVFANDPKVRLHVSAIGDKSEKKLIHLSARDDSSSLLEIAEAQSQYFPGTQEVGTFEVEVGPLQKYITKDEIVRPALLKLDVQGYEMEALAGCRSLIDSFDYVYCECSFVELYKGQKLAGQVIHYLGELGFYLTGVFNLAHDQHGNCIQADFLFQQSPGPSCAS